MVDRISESKLFFLWKHCVHCYTVGWSCIGHIFLHDKSEQPMEGKQIIGKYILISRTVGSISYIAKQIMC